MSAFVRCEFCIKAYPSEAVDAAERSALAANDFNFRFCRCQEGEKALEKWRKGGMKDGLTMARRVCEYLPADVRFKSWFKRVVWKILKHLEAA